MLALRRVCADRALRFIDARIADLRVVDEHDVVARWTAVAHRIEALLEAKARDATV